VRRYMPHLLELIRNGTIDAKGIISHRLPLEEAKDAYFTFRDKKDDCIKCVLIPKHAQH
jgi:threonine dehydrogenase-like Zn-dependent dehydrogenase